MRALLKEVFIDHEFSESIEKRFGEKTVVDESVDVFVNDYDEMYFIIFGKLQIDTLSRIINLCAEVEKNQFYKKSWKSNWVVLYITELPADLTDEQKKIVMQIEENKFFCRKYVFWYSDKEKEALKKLCENNFSKETFNRIISDEKLFGEFKKKGNMGYECLSRMYIKLPFLNLRYIPTTEETIYTCINKELDLINEKLTGIFEDGEVNKIIELIELDPKDLKELDKKIKAIEGDD